MWETLALTILFGAFMWTVGWAAGWNARNRRDVPEFVARLDDYRRDRWAA
jgi:hypothetical protein